MLSQHLMTELHRELARRSMTQVVEDWEMIAGCTMEIGESTGSLIHSLDEWRPAWKANWSLVLSTRVEGDCEGDYHILFPVPLAWELTKAVLCLPAKSPLDKSGLDEGHMEVMQEMMNLLCGSISSAFLEVHRQLRISGNVDDIRLVQLGPKDPLGSQLAKVGRGLGVSIDLTCNDAKHEVLAVMPFPVARSIARLFLAA